MSIRGRFPFRRLKSTPTPRNRTLSEDHALRPSFQRNILNADKRKIILAVIARGCSRRMAAGFVGCVPRTITRTANRDPEFAAALVRAENAARIAFTSRINAAAAEPRYWRAAAWWLERRDADEFAAQPQFTLTREQAAEIFADFIYYLEDDIRTRRLT